MANIRQADEPKPGHLIGSALCGLAVGAAASAFLGVGLSAAAMLSEDPEILLGGLSAAVRLIGAVLCGFAAARQEPSAPHLAGLLGGAAYVLLYWVLALIFGGGRMGSPVLWALGYALCPAGALLGSIPGRKRMKAPGEGKKNPAAMARLRAMKKR